MTAPDFTQDFLIELGDAALAREGKTTANSEILFRCPFPDHDDVHPSARWSALKATFYCDICQTGGGALQLATLLGIDRPKGMGGGGRKSTPPKQHCNTATLRMHPRRLRRSQAASG